MKPLHWALLALLLLLLPVLLLGPHAYVLIHDCLDTEISLAVLLAKRHLAFAYAPGVTVPEVMNGIPRNALRPGLSGTMLLYSLFAAEPWWAYLVQLALVRVGGLLSMYWLLRGHGLREPGQRGLAAAVALAWAMLPVYSIYGLTVLGQPALLRAALDLRRGRRVVLALAVCAAFPLWSSFVYVGPFVAVVWGGWLAGQLLQGERAAAGRGALGLGLLLALYVVVEYPLFYSIVVARQFVSHREEFDYQRLVPQGLRAGLQEAGRFFWVGQYHASPFFRGVVVLALGLAWRQAPPKRRRLLGLRAGTILAVMAGLALFCGFALQLAGRLQHQLPLLTAFNFNRFHFLFSLAWFGVLALSLRELPLQQPAARRLAYGLVALQFLVQLPLHEEYLTNLRLAVGRPKAAAPSYEAFVAPALLGRVQAYIRQRTGQAPAAYRVASLGLPPAVAQLNGFYTLDSNQNSYPLPYKHAFRPLIAGELAKSEPLEVYFDAWGNRCYVQAAELGRNYSFGKQAGRTVQHFAFGTAQFRQLGGSYLLAAVRLANPAESGLKLLAVFNDPAAYWRIYLYEAI